MSIKCSVKAVELAKAMQKADLMEEAAVTAISQGVVRDSAPFVPRLEGSLRQTAETESDYVSGKVIYGNRSVPYAAAHYYAPGNWNYTTPGTGPRWFEKAQAKHMKQWLAEGEKAVKEAASK